MQYLKSKIISKDETSSTKLDDEKESSKTNHHDDESSEEESENEETEPTTSQKHDSKPIQTIWTLKMRGLPFKIKDKHIIEFFSPIKVVNIRLVKNKKGQPSGIAFIDFKCKEDLEKALKRDKDYLEGRYIELFKDESKAWQQKEREKEEEKPWVKKLKESKNEGEEDESIGEVSMIIICRKYSNFIKEVLIVGRVCKLDIKKCSIIGRSSTMFNSNFFRLF